MALSRRPPARRAITIAGRQGLESATLVWYFADGYHVEVERADGRTVSSTSPDDYFECFLGVRRELEAEGALLCVQGAHLDVWVTQFWRQNGGGLHAQILRMEKPLVGGLVCIFDPADPKEVVTVAEQRRYVKAWGLHID